MDAFDSAGRLVGAPNYSYFLTDGIPSWGDGNTTTLTNQASAATGDRGIQATEEAQWVSFLNANGIKSQALAFSASFSAASIGQINPVAYDGTTGTELNGIHVPDPNNLSSVLNALARQPITGTIPGSTGVDEITGTPEKIDAFADLMRPLGLRELARPGVAALSRGA